MGPVSAFDFNDLKSLQFLAMSPVTLLAFAALIGEPANLLSAQIIQHLQLNYGAVDGGFADLNVGTFSHHEDVLAFELRILIIAGELGQEDLILFNRVLMTCHFDYSEHNNYLNVNDNST